MRSKWLKILVLGVGVSATGVAGFFAWQSSRMMDTLPLAELSVEEVMAIEGGGPSAQHGGEHGAQASAHGAPPADAHGAPAADAHGAPPADAHGAPAADAHGAPPADAHGGGHGSAAAAPARSPAGLALISFDEIFVNIGSGEYGARSLALKLEIELFEESERAMVDQRQSGVKDTIITVAKEQDYFKLNSLSGKLYFKESLVSKINGFFKAPVVKEVHFSSFFLQ